MVLIARDYRQGLRAATPVPVAIVATLAANAQTIFIVPTGRTLIVRKIHIHNRNGAQTVVTFGTGVAGAFVQALPGIVVPAGMDVELTEEEILAVEVGASLTAWASAAAAAPADVHVSVEVELLEGLSG